MADLLGSMRVEIVGDNSKLDKSIKESEKNTKRFGKETAALGKSLGTLFAGIGFAVVAKKIFDISKKASQLSASGEEIRSKFNAVFKDGAEDVKAWAEEYSSSVGRSDTQTLSFLATLQDTFVPMGIARDTAADFSKVMVQLSGDVGSFNDVAQSDVIRDFQSALVGNTETVRKYGVVINEANTLQEALNSGLIDNKSQLTEQVKIQARMNLILAGTTDAQGDLARTQDSTTNINAALNSQIEKSLEVYGSLVNEGLKPFKLNLLDEITTINKNIKAHFLRQKVMEGNATAVEDLTLKQLELEKAEKALAQARVNVTNATQQNLEITGLDEIQTARIIAAKAEAIKKAELTILALEDEVKLRGLSVQTAQEVLDSENALLDANIAQATALEEANALTGINTELTDENTDAVNENTEASFQNAAFIQAQLDNQTFAHRAFTEAIIADNEEIKLSNEELWTEFSAAGLNALTAIDSLASATASAELQRLEESGASQEELDAKKKEIARDEAKRKKALGLLSVGIDTASAIIGFLADPGGFAGVALSVLAGVTGGIQAAAISATPLPSFADGGIVPGRASKIDNTIANVASGELIANQDQKDRMLMEFLNGGGSRGGGTTVVEAKIDKKILFSIILDGSKSGQAQFDARSIINQ